MSVPQDSFKHLLPDLKNPDVKRLKKNCDAVTFICGLSNLQMNWNYARLFEQSRSLHGLEPVCMYIYIVYLGLIGFMRKFLLLSLSVGGAGHSGNCTQRS